MYTLKRVRLQKNNISIFEGVIVKKIINMTSDKVLDLYNWLNENNIAVWIDGGWCVDALLGRQTREHADLDIAVHRYPQYVLLQI